MNEIIYNIHLNINELVEMVRQMPKEDRVQLKEELARLDRLEAFSIDPDRMISIMRSIKPYFKEKLGKNTHKKTSEDWRFYGLAFTHPEMIYVFGINIGFFRKCDSPSFNCIGMNVLVRTNGNHLERREGILSFFRENLKDWVNLPEGKYSSDRGGEGIEFSHYECIDAFESDEAMVQYLKSCINSLRPVYYKIMEQINVFEGVVRAAPQWDLDLMTFCKNVLKNK